MCSTLQSEEYLCAEDGAARVDWNTVKLDTETHALDCVSAVAHVWRLALEEGNTVGVFRVLDDNTTICQRLGSDLAAVRDGRRVDVDLTSRRLEREQVVEPRALAA